MLNWQYLWSMSHFYVVYFKTEIGEKKKCTFQLI